MYSLHSRQSPPQQIFIHNRIFYSHLNAISFQTAVKIDSYIIIFYISIDCQFEGLFLRRLLQWLALAFSTLSNSGLCFLATNSDLLYRS